MKKATITVTEASRNFADCVSRVHYQKMSFLLLKNGKPFAQLIPASEKVCTGRELAKAIENADISPEEARAWHKDLVAGRRRLVNPGDKWR